MFLVHKSGDNGKWGVSWMWLPHFLALDRELHKFVDEGMTKVFKGQHIPNQEHLRNQLLRRMDAEVIDLILYKYPIPGLEEYLNAIRDLAPEESMEV